MDVLELAPTFQVVSARPLSAATLARYIAYTKRAQALATEPQARFLLELQLFIMETMAGSAAPDAPQ